MHGITFGEFHSYTNFGLWLTGEVIGLPEPKRTTVEVPGTDGALDLSYALSEEMHYKERQLTFTFQIADGSYGWDAKLRAFANAIHGKKLQVIQDSDPNYYWDAFCTVEQPKFDKKIMTVSVKCKADPYKYKTALTTKSASVSGSGTITCTNLKKKVVPEITTSAAITVALGSHSVSLEAGTHRVAALALSEGTNTFTVTGTADVSISYREGSL